MCLAEQFLDNNESLSNKGIGCIRLWIQLLVLGFVDNKKALEHKQTLEKEYTHNKSKLQKTTCAYTLNYH